MQNIDKKVSTENLIDIQNIKIDTRLSKKERILSYLEQIKNPYHFRVGNVKVRVSFSNNENTLDDSFGEIISALS